MQGLKSGMDQNGDSDSQGRVVTTTLRSLREPASDALGNSKKYMLATLDRKLNKFNQLGVKI